MDETKAPDGFAKISVEEGERRRTHVRAAIAENRLEGIKTSPETLYLGLYS